MRFLHHQLVAVRPADASVFSIGSVRWISVAGNHLMRLGTHTMPGVPKGVALRLGGIKAHRERFVPALLLPAVAALRTPPTLIIPAGWYRPKRLVEVLDAQLDPVLLTTAIERGSDFERCTFQPA